VGRGTISPNRHAGLVPASTVPHTHRPLVTRPGGPRDEPGVTQDDARHVRVHDTKPLGRGGSGEGRDASGRCRLCVVRSDVANLL